MLFLLRRVGDGEGGVDLSLDVYLTIPGKTKEGTGIYIRENGQNREVTWDEWNERFPGREPVVASTSSEVYEANITHNLNRMADYAGLYEALWQPKELGITKASQLIEHLKAGLKVLKDNPDAMKQFNPENGWGDYEGLVSFVERYLAACEEYPQADVSVSR